MTNKYCKFRSSPVALVPLQESDMKKSKDLQDSPYPHRASRDLTGTTGGKPHRKSWEVSPESIEIQLSEDNVKTFSENLWAFPVNWEFNLGGAQTRTPSVRSARERLKKKREALDPLSESASSSSSTSKGRPEFEGPLVHVGSKESSDYFRDWRYLREAEEARGSRGAAHKHSSNIPSPALEHGSRTLTPLERGHEGEEQRIITRSPTKQIQSLHSGHAMTGSLSAMSKTPDLQEIMQSGQIDNPFDNLLAEIDIRTEKTPLPSEGRTQRARWQFPRSQFPSIGRSVGSVPRLRRRFEELAGMHEDQARLPTLQSKLPELPSSRFRSQAAGTDPKKREELPAIRKKEMDLPKLK